MSKKPAFIVNGQGIPGSVWGRLLKVAETPYEAGLFIFRARKANNIVAYLMDGLRKKTIFLPKLEEEGSAEKIRGWVEENILKYAPVESEKKTVTIKSDDMSPIGDTERCASCKKLLSKEEIENRNCWDCEYCW